MFDVSYFAQGVEIEMKDGICPKCQATDVVGEISRPGEGGFNRVNFGVMLSLFSRVDAKIRAWVCCECGYTEFYSQNARRLGKAVDQLVNNGPKRADNPVRVSSPGES